MNLFWLGYAAFHLGQYQKALDVGLIAIRFSFHFLGIQGCFKDRPQLCRYAFISCMLFILFGTVQRGGSRG